KNTINTCEKIFRIISDNDNKNKYCNKCFRYNKNNKKNNNFPIDSNNNYDNDKNGNMFLDYKDIELPGALEILNLRAPIYKKIPISIQHDLFKLYIKIMNFIVIADKNNDNETMSKG